MCARVYATQHVMKHCMSFVSPVYRTNVARPQCHCYVTFFVPVRSCCSVHIMCDVKKFHPQCCHTCIIISGSRDRPRQVHEDAFTFHCCLAGGDALDADWPRPPLPRLFLFFFPLPSPPPPC